MCSIIAKCDRTFKLKIIVDIWTLNKKRLRLRWRGPSEGGSRFFYLKYFRTYIGYAKSDAMNAADCA